jgi:hypothetical protein
MLSYVQICKGCGSIIKFIKTTNGKFTPCNTNRIFFYEDKNGKERLVTKDGKVVTGVLCASDHPNALVGYLSHFATCPNAKQFRRGGY